MCIRDRLKQRSCSSIKSVIAIDHEETELFLTVIAKEYLVKLGHIRCRRILAFVPIAVLATSMQHLIAIEQEWPWEPLGRLFKGGCGKFPTDAYWHACEGVCGASMTIGLIVDHHGSDHLLNDWFKQVSLTGKISVNNQFRSGFWKQHCLSINLSAVLIRSEGFQK